MKTLDKIIMLLKPCDVFKYTNSLKWAEFPTVPFRSVVALPLRSYALLHGSCDHQNIVPACKLCGVAMHLNCRVQLYSFHRTLNEQLSHLICDSYSYMICLILIVFYWKDIFWRWHEFCVIKTVTSGNLYLLNRKYLWNNVYTPIF